MKNIFFFSFFFLLLFILSNSCHAKEDPHHKKEKRIRLPVVAGQFYPGEKNTLTKMIDEFFKEAKGGPLPNIRGLVSPHAGYIYSGIVAASGYKQIDPATKMVIVLAPSHSIGIAKASIPEVDYYETPLGTIPLSAIAATLRQQKLFSPVPSMHQREHSLEVQLPFLQKILTDFELVPIIVGQIKAKLIAEALLPHVNKNTLIVASSDLSHYYPYDQAVGLDKICTQAITSLNLGEMAECEACGKIPVMVLMEIARQKGWEGHLLDYRNSGDTSGQKSQVVGYTSIAFTNQSGKENEQSQSDSKIENQEKVSEKDKKNLLNLARETIADVLLRGGKKPSQQKTEFSAYLKEKRGCFVTLHKKGALRGCIGAILPHERLCDCIEENALNAAFHDPRFPALRKDELDQIDLEISILTLPRQIQFTNGEDLKKQLRPNKDGVILSQGWHKATYLPQVWEQLPDKNKFLESLCQKASLPKDAWKDPKTKIEVYEAIVFGEK